MVIVTISKGPNPWLKEMLWFKKVMAGFWHLRKCMGFSLMALNSISYSLTLKMPSPLIGTNLKHPKDLESLSLPQLPKTP
jgi:hypothetical protein